MSDESPSPSHKDFDARLRAARAKRASTRDGAEAPARDGGLGFALRIGVEIVAALGVGVGIGLLLDRWLGTAPWMLLLFFVLGAAAGMMNMYRLMSGYGYAAGYAPPEETEETNGRSEPDEDRDRDR